MKFSRKRRTGELGFADYCNAYAERGMSIIPLVPGTKRSIVRDWSRYCEKLTTVEERELWASKYPKNGFALCLGKQSKLVSFDYDLDLTEANNEISELIESLLPTTPLTKFGRKGFQKFFRYEGQKTLRFRCDKSRQTIFEVLSDGTYTVLPPSTHPETLNPYHWDKSIGILDVDIRTIPSITDADIQVIRSRVEELLGNTRAKTTKSSGGRNNKLKDMASAAIHRGKDDRTIVAELIQYDRETHHPPLFTDLTEGFSLDASEGALKFVTNIRKSILGGATYSEDPQKDKNPFAKLGDPVDEPTEMQWIVDKFLARSSISALVSAPKSGKSTLARQLMAEVVKGGSFLGRACKRGRVLYLSYEEALAQYQEHLASLGLVDGQDFYYMKRNSIKPGIDQLRKFVHEMSIDLVVIDTMQKFLSVPDLNDYSSVTKALAPLDEFVKSSRCHVLMIHHASKGTERRGGDAILGSTAIRGGTDLNILFEGSGDSPRTLTSEGRNGEFFSRQSLIFDSELKTYSLPSDDESPLTERTKTKVYQFLKKNPDEQYLQDEILKVVPLRKREVISALRQLVESKRIVKCGSGAKGQPFRYSISVPS